MLGWYPTFIDYPVLPDDLIDVPEALYRSLLGKSLAVDGDGMPCEAPMEAPTADALLALLTAALQGELDARARALGYDDIKTAITYRGDPNPKFDAEAQALFVWRSAVWTQAYALLAQVQQGQAQFPTIEEAVAMMPALVIDVPHPI